jgi:hypothetical protein
MASGIVIAVLSGLDASSMVESGGLASGVWSSGGVSGEFDGGSGERVEAFEALDGLRM